MHSTVLIIPAALKADANLLGAALGYGPESYTVPIPSDGKPTHWGGHVWASAEFFKLISIARGGSLPPLDWAAHKLTAARVRAVIAALIVGAPGSPLDPDGVPYASPGDHWAAVVVKARAPKGFDAIK